MVLLLPLTTDFCLCINFRTIFHICLMYGTIDIPNQKITWFDFGWMIIERIIEW